MAITLTPAITGHAVAGRTIVGLVFGPLAPGAAAYEASHLRPLSVSHGEPSVWRPR